MKKMLLTEFNALCKDGICRDLLSEREKREMEHGVVYLSGRLQTADKKNGNGRSYPYKVLKREMDNYKKIVSEPSTPNAYVYPKEQGRMYENKINEAKRNIVDDLFKKILED